MIQSVREMSTTKTTTIALRVPSELADAIREDASDLGTTPSGLLRTILEKRYFVSRDARNSNGRARKSNDDEYVRFAE